MYINLIDSDLLHLRRYDCGIVVDDYCNETMEGYEGYTGDTEWLSDWGELTEEQYNSVAKGKGNLEKWKDLVTQNVNLDDLRKAWDSDLVFAYDILGTSVQAFDMSDEEVWSDFTDEIFARLTFRLTEPRLYEIQAEGPPKLGLHSSPLLSTTEVLVGSPLETTLTVSVANHGGAAKGLDIIVWGTVLDKNLINLTKVGIQEIDHMAGIKEADFILQKTEAKGKEAIRYIASYESFEIPSGIANIDEAWSQENVLWWKVHDAVEKTAFYVRLYGSIERPGAGDISIAFVPHSNREDGYILYQNKMNLVTTFSDYNTQ